MTRTLAVTGFLIGILAAQTPPNPPQFVSDQTDFEGVAVHSDGRTAWAAAKNGLVYRTTDGGVNWTAVDVPGSGALNAIRFHADGMRGWAVGDRRVVYTVDGGLTWSVPKGVPSWSSCSLYDVLFDAEGNRGFAVGWTDMILATEDGGLSWARVADDLSKYGFSSISFDARFRIGLIGGAEGVFRTEDGGHSWKRQQGEFHSVTAVWTNSDGTGSAVMSTPLESSEKRETFWYRDPGTGEGWTEVRAMTVDQPAAVLRDRDSVAVGKNGIFYEHDGNGALEHVLEGSYSGVAFATGSPTGLAVGELGRVASTSDGGKTWRVVHEWKNLGSLNRVVWQSSPERIWAVGDKVLRSEDGGRSFSDQAITGFPGETGQALDLKFSSDGRLGWITTQKGRILRTTDGGENWVQGSISHPEGRAIRSVSFDRDALRGITVGAGEVLATSDRGAHWVGQASRMGLLDDVWLMPNGRTAWALSNPENLEKGRILRTDDGGELWREVLNPSQAFLNRIVFTADGRVGWIAGSQGTILRTENGGRTWLAGRLSNRTNVWVTELWFDAAGLHGWAVANTDRNPVLLRSVDSGRSWNFTAATPAHYEHITMTPDGRRGWALAGNLIMRTAHETQGPQITRFEVTSPDFLVDLVAQDADTPTQDVRATIDVDGKGLIADQVRREFKVSESDGVNWPKGLFRSGESYTFHLQLTDGWNVTTRDFRLGPPAALDISQSPSVPSLLVEVPELHGIDLTAARVLLDGQPVETAEIMTRGGDGSVSVRPSASVLQRLPNGFHALTVAGSSREILRNIGFYKDQLTLKLFRPYLRSFALIVAVGNYPAESGYRKLESAVRQAQELENTLRVQGFTVLPPLYDRDATRSRIETALRTAPAGPEDRLFVYFGGHGDDEKGFQGKPIGYLVPYDGRKSDLWGTAIPLDKIAGEYSSRLRAKHVLFALDSCQSGLAISRGGPLELSVEELKRFKALADIESLTNEPGRTILTAGTGGQDALDVSGGIFTAALIDGIGGRADADRNGVVDYFELFSYVWGRVNAEARQWIRKQQPADYQLGNGRWVFVHQ